MSWGGKNKGKLSGHKLEVKMFRELWGKTRTVRDLIFQSVHLNAKGETVQNMSQKI